MKVVRQFNSWSCQACVAAMITGTTLKEVINFIGHDGSEIVEGSKHPNGYRGFTMAEINLYLAHHKFTMGVFGAKIKGFEPTFYNEYEYMDVRIDLSLPALIIVESTLAEGMMHCLYFDGTNVYDPYYPDSVELKNYTILEWWPVIKLT